MNRIIILLILSLLIASSARADVVSDPGMVDVKGGCFEMGDDFGEGDVFEKPIHEVCVNDFKIGAKEVTYRQFKEFVFDTGYVTEAERGEGCYGWVGIKFQKELGFTWRLVGIGYEQTVEFPAACISWNDSKAYIAWLNKKTGKTYRLPTEAEWEYAARGGGKKFKYSGTNDDAKLGEFAWYKENSGQRSHPTGQKQANGLGIFDMTGNVEEWVNDWYNRDYYKISPKDNPKGPETGICKVVRGGAWSNVASGERISSRHCTNPKKAITYLGFRLAM